MSDAIVPALPANNDSPKESHQREFRQKAHAGDNAGNAVPSREQCLIALAALPGLVAMRVITPAQANAMRGTYEAILREHDRARQGPTEQLSDDDVLKIWREQPDIIEMLEPILTAQQLDKVMSASVGQ